MTKSTDKLTKAQVLKIPDLINKGLSVGAVAKLYGCSWQNIWYFIKRLKEDGFIINTRKRGQVKMKLSDKKIK